MAVTNELIDKLIAEYKRPEDILGEKGLLKQLTKGMKRTLVPSIH